MDTAALDRSTIDRTESTTRRLPATRRDRRVTTTVVAADSELASVAQPDFQVRHRDALRLTVSSLVVALARRQGG